MGKNGLLFCDICNPDRVHQQDRRAAEETQAPEDRRSSADRRQVRERRVRDRLPEGRQERRNSVGRRPFDGQAWFEGLIEGALSEDWTLEERQGILICPRCRRRDS
ncbi:MAG: hypothetical protein HQL82_06190 [Magnetococcales bacterium]|nr:hypothetical protein [Magnetococcales bacterium]